MNKFCYYRKKQHFPIHEVIINIQLFHNDLPENFNLTGDIAIDTETLGLNLFRDRLCLLQFSSGDGNIYLVKFDGNNYNCVYLKKLLLDKTRTKIFHFARFDLAMIKNYLKISLENVFCTKIASRIGRTYTDQHSLKDLCRELVGVNLSKQQQSSNWGATELSTDQQKYAARDVLYLHEIKTKLINLLNSQNRLDLAMSIMQCLNVRVELDINGFEHLDIFAH